MAKQRGRPRRPARHAPPTPREVVSAPVAYTVRLTESAERVYRSLHERVSAVNARDEVSSSHHTALRMVDEALDTIQRDPLNKKYALTGVLKNTFRIKKGRMRICWIASSERREAVVLFISETLRKEGDVHDPYKLFTDLVMTGRYDELFDRLGVKRPNRRLSGAISPSATAMLQPFVQFPIVSRH